MQTQVKQLDFSGQNIYIGLDVHHKQLTATFCGDHLTHKTFSHQPDPEIIIKYLKKNFPGANYYAAYEAGFSGYWLQEALKEAGVDCIVVNAADIPTMDKERKQKRDPVDSRKIARALKNRELDAIYIPGKLQQFDRSLIRTRETLVKEQTRCRNRIKAMLYFYGIAYPEEFLHPATHWSKKFMKWLHQINVKNEEWNNAFKAYLKQAESHSLILKETTRSIEHLSKDKRYAEKVNLLMSIPGVGRLTAMVILVELMDIRRFKNQDKLHAYVGLIPDVHNSGDKERIGDITKRGNKLVKKYLFESSWTAVSKDPALMMKYNELCSRMKPNKAIVRIARKLLNRIRYVLIHQCNYQLNTVK